MSAQRTVSASDAVDAFDRFVEAIDTAFAPTAIHVAMRDAATGDPRAAQVMLDEYRVLFDGLDRAIEARSSEPSRSSDLAYAIVVNVARDVADLDALLSGEMIACPALWLRLVNVVGEDGLANAQRLYGEED